MVRGRKSVATAKMNGHSEPEVKGQTKVNLKGQDKVDLKGETRKRGRPTASGQPKKAKLDEEPELKVNFRLKDQNRFVTSAVTLTLGQGDTGQLGLGEDIMERSKPALVKALGDASIVDIEAGGMHSVVLTSEGKVMTFGCNDEGALGRHTADDDECYTPAEVKLPGKVVQVTAGDSHSVALTEDGRAFYWGTFRDSSGSFGLTENGIEKLPKPLAADLKIRKIASGADHVALLTADGQLYTLGCAEQGQLGRVSPRLTARGGRRGLSLLHNPDKVHAKNRRAAFADVWAGSYSTYALTTDGDILVSGLNNYNQLGVAKGQMFYTLVKSPSFSANKAGWTNIAPGQHHALALDKDGHAYAIGRMEYGRLGLGSDAKKDATEPTAIPGLKGKKIVDVSCGTAVSFAVADDGAIYSWGMGTNGQLGHEDDEDAWEPKNMLGKQLETRRALLASGGGQHTLVLAVDK